MGIFRAQDSTKNQFRPFPHSPPRIIRHPSPPHQFAISSVPIRSWPSDRSLVDIRQSGWGIKARHINQLYKTKHVKRNEYHTVFLLLKPTTQHYLKVLFSYALIYNAY